VRHGQDANSDVIVSDLTYWDEAGAPLAHIDGMAVCRAPADRFLSKPALAEADHLYQLTWEPVVVSEAAARRDHSFAVVGGGNESRSLADLLGAP
jgi:hypothetical protein